MCLRLFLYLSLSSLSDSQTRGRKYSDWIDLMVKHLKDQPFGKVLGYVGQEGVFSYFKDRQEAEIDIPAFLNQPT